MTSQQKAIEGTFEVFHRPVDGTDGFVRCGHSHENINEAWECEKQISRDLYERPHTYGGLAVHIGRIHIHPGGPWHKPGEVVGIEVAGSGYDGLPIWESDSSYEKR